MESALMASVVEAALLQSLGLPVPDASVTDPVGAPSQLQRPQTPTSGALDSVPRYAMSPPRLVPHGTGVSASGSFGGTGGGNSTAVQLASGYLGTPYQWGGSSQSGIDCSGLVQQVYGRMGIRLPRTTYEQVNSGQPVGSLADARPGDLVFFHPGAGGPGHVGIYTGGGQMIDANHTGGSVGVRPIAGYGPVAAIRRVA